MSFELLEHGDSVMADRGFVIAEDLKEFGVELNIRHFLDGKPQLSLQEEDETRSTAKVRLQVERLLKLSTLAYSRHFPELDGIVAVSHLEKVSSTV